MADLQQLREIAAKLRELQRTSPTNPVDLADWDASARKFSSELHVSVPAQVMHYLHDADIRIKDPEYRKAQDEILTDIITDLEHGKASQSTGVSLSFHPHWLGLVALIVLAILYWAVAR
jgi:hypothetical protein